MLRVRPRCRQDGCHLLFRCGGSHQARGCRCWREVPPLCPSQFSFLRNGGNGRPAPGPWGAPFPRCVWSWALAGVPGERARARRSPRLWAACGTEGQARRGAGSGEEDAPNHWQGPGRQTTGRRPGRAKLSAEDRKGNVTDKLAFGTRCSPHWARGVSLGGGLAGPERPMRRGQGPPGAGRSGRGQRGWGWRGRGLRVELLATGDVCPRLGWDPRSCIRVQMMT